MWARERVRGSGCGFRKGVGAEGACVRVDLFLLFALCLEVVSG